jgi:hypothetical protein
MSKIKNMNDLREAALDTIEALQKGEIDISQAQTMGKLCDSVIGTVNAQYAYAKIIGQQPMIPFMDEAHKERLLEGELVESTVSKRLNQMK